MFVGIQKLIYVKFVIMEKSKINAQVTADGLVASHRVA
jgi:hypothetical protein